MAYTPGISLETFHCDYLLSYTDLNKTHTQKIKHFEVCQFHGIFSGFKKVLATTKYILPVLSI